MDELEEHRELDRLIEEQQRDDSGVVFPEHSDTVSLDGLENHLAVEDGELIDMRPRERGSILVGGASWHGTIGGYNNHKCKCARCRAAIKEYRRLRRERAEASA